MSDLTSRVAKTVGRHFVTLSCVQHPPRNHQASILVFSGFVVEVVGEWFYVTAGHILRDIRTATEEGGTFDIWRLGDQTAGNKFNDTAIPYSFELGYWVVLEDSQTGLDYAAVHLAGLYRQQLEVGGVTAIAKDAWSDHLTDHDHWALVGIPSESVAYDGKSIITARVVIAPLVPADEPALADQKAQNQFYAKLVDGSEQFVKDVDGMSGGPIFSLKKVDETWMYSVIGVQSAWYRTSRTLAACPFSSFGLALEETVREVLSNYAQSGPVQSAT
jgi:hypothetical protein